MIFLLDTDTCSAHMRHPTRLAHRFVQYANGLAISTIVRKLPLLGTAGILLRAKEQGRIVAVRPPWGAVRQAGLDRTERLDRTVLRLAGE